ncbi:MAG TPA: DUF3362 domain-containing protein, partial [Desulfuromonadales bacterium]|nr:DUF3362 domain-containing protein [Desulfuromonadales bacterium]
LNKSDKRAVRLLRRVRQHRKVKHAFIASGIRFDLLAYQQGYFEELLAHHVGGLLKVAPESVSEGVTCIMRKPGPKLFVDFLRQFWAFGRQHGRRQGVVPYFISSHPGCTLSDMVDVALFLCRHGLKVEQVQEFTPTPGTLSTCMYYTGRDPFTGQTVHVPRTQKEKRLQKALLLYHLPESRNDVIEALRASRRQDVAMELLGDNGKQRRPLRSRNARTPS